ncbi:MAG: hypothetical protein IJT16_04150 [Lachnospiraceae bacterium]|nr:hypothetical protein [Lachnospiraceae bacterium]
MGGVLIFYVLLFVVFYQIIVKSRKNAKTGGLKQPVAAQKSYDKAQAASKVQSAAAVNRAMQQPAGILSGEAGGKAYLLLDDRKNDWLARQLEEERRAAFKVSSMFGFKYNAGADHAANCDAKELRDEHSKNCEAEGVDTARGK